MEREVVPVPFGASSRKPVRDQKPVGVGITVVLYFMAIGFLLWLLCEWRPWRMSGVRPRLRPLLAWATFEVIFGGLIAVLGLLGWLKD